MILHLFIFCGKNIFVKNKKLEKDSYQKVFGGCFLRYKINLRKTLLL